MVTEIQTTVNKEKIRQAIKQIISEIGIDNEQAYLKIIGAVHGIIEKGNYDTVKIIVSVIGKYMQSIPVIKIKIQLYHFNKVVKVYELSWNLKHEIHISNVKPSQEKEYLRFLLNIATNAKAVFPYNRLDWKVKHRSKDSGYTAFVRDYFRILHYIEDLLQSRNALKYLYLAKYGYSLRYDILFS